MSNIFIWVKKDLFGCFRIEEIRDKANETGLKEERGIEMSTTVLPYTRCTLKYLPSSFRCCVGRICRSCFLYFI